jgi:flagellar biosynthesis regulator FlaF
MKLPLMTASRRKNSRTRIRVAIGQPSVRVWIMLGDPRRSEKNSLKIRMRGTYLSLNDVDKEARLAP